MNAFGLFFPADITYRTSMVYHILLESTKSSSRGKPYLYVLSIVVSISAPYILFSCSRTHTVPMSNSIFLPHTQSRNRVCRNTIFMQGNLHCQIEFMAVSVLHFSLKKLYVPWLYICTVIAHLRVLPALPTKWFSFSSKR